MGDTIVRISRLDEFRDYVSESIEESVHYYSHFRIISPNNDIDCPSCQLKPDSFAFWTRNLVNNGPKQKLSTDNCFFIRIFIRK